MALDELQAVISTPTHPLARLTNTEIDAARKLLTAEGLVGPSVRFALLALEEPDKAEVPRFPHRRRHRSTRARHAASTSRPVDHTTSSSR